MLTFNDAPVSGHRLDIGAGLDVRHMPWFWARPIRGQGNGGVAMEKSVQGPSGASGAEGASGDRRAQTYIHPVCLSGPSPTNREPPVWFYQMPSESRCAKNFYLRPLRLSNKRNFFSRLEITPPGPPKFTAPNSF